MRVHSFPSNLLLGIHVNLLQFQNDIVCILQVIQVTYIGGVSINVELVRELETMFTIFHINLSVETPLNGEWKDWKYPKAIKCYLYKW